jgi:hypothetical protein
MDPDAMSLREYLGPIPERLDRYEWEHCRIRSHQTLVVPLNWKVAIEAFVEPYHVVATHPQLRRWGHGKASPTEEYLTPGFIHAGHYGGRHYDFNEEAEFQDVREYLYTSAYSTYHNLHGLYHEDGLRAAERLVEEGPEGMTLQEASALHFKFRREEMIESGAKYPEGLEPQDLGIYAPGKEPDFEYERYDNLSDFKGRNPILEQDFSNMLAVHKGTHSRGFKGARPNPVQESQVGNFHRVLHEFVHDTDR